MYRKRDRNQVKLEDFIQPFNGQLTAENRWVKAAKIMPWEMIEDIYTFYWDSKGSAEFLVQKYSKLTLEYLDKQKEWITLVRYEKPLHDRQVVHQFNTVKVGQIRLCIWKTKADSGGYYKPGICRFEAYLR